MDGCCRVCLMGFLQLIVSSVPADAVCDFCKKKESELYQKEVCIQSGAHG